MRARGFTLIELMVTVVVMAILAASAVPSFRNMILQNRASTHVNELVSALSVARSEAIKRGVQVELLAQGADVTTGWTVQVPAEGATPAIVIRSHEPLSQSEICPAATCSNTAIYGDVTEPVPTQFVFNRLGGLDVGAGSTMILTPVDCPVGRDMGRRIEINAVGRITTARVVCP